MENLDETENAYRDEPSYYGWGFHQYSLKYCTHNVNDAISYEKSLNKKRGGEEQRTDSHRKAIP